MVPDLEIYLFLTVSAVWYDASVGMYCILKHQPIRSFKCLNIINIFFTPKLKWTLHYVTLKIRGCRNLVFQSGKYATKLRYRFYVWIGFFVHWMRVELVKVIHYLYGTTKVTQWVNMLEKPWVRILICIPGFILTLETCLSCMKIFMFPVFLVGRSWDDTLN